VRPNKDGYREIFHTMLNIYYTSLIPNKTPRKSLNLIFMDIQLPRMDGITALKQLRANPQTKSIAVSKQYLENKLQLWDWNHDAAFIGMSWVEFY
jgi:DNA-binding NarL/FixJ family response regulator